MLLWEAQPGPLAPEPTNADLFDMWNVHIDGQPLLANQTLRTKLTVPGGLANQFAFSIPQGNIGRPAEVGYSVVITKFVGSTSGLIDVNTKFYEETRDIEMTLFCDSTMDVETIQPNLEVDTSLLDLGDEIRERRIPGLFRSPRGVRTATITLPGARKGSSVHFVIQRRIPASQKHTRHR